ncbi:hypothetical protein [uncultured Bilophila sp.]|uniref:hypothetical protein n=1 Tax=uncultured Bilophila sp. TaxID=529385 RepID=UPI00280C3980|nr:hypothetical protein [uncultured Bilophila sp.]
MMPPLTPSARSLKTNTPDGFRPGCLFSKTAFHSTAVPFLRQRGTCFLPVIVFFGGLSWDMVVSSPQDNEKYGLFSGFLIGGIHDYGILLAIPLELQGKKH